MQKAVFLWFCLLFSRHLLGQQTPQITQKNDIRIETYFYHQTNYDSFRLHIKGKNDTFLTETFYRNGRLYEQVFGKDSTLNFNHLGTITAKFFGERDSFYLFGENREVTEKRFFKQDDNTWDSTVTYSDKWVSMRSVRYEDSYNAMGNDTIHTIRYPIGQYGSYGYSQKVGAMFKQKAFFRDTIFEDGEPIPQQIDTVFRENGYLASINIRNGDERVTLSYDSAGKLRKDLDEKKLIPFKDNILCAYGFLNELGDTIVSARYDRVERLGIGNIVYKVFVGDRCFILKYPNIILNTPEANDI